MVADVEVFDRVKVHTGVPLKPLLMLVQLAVTVPLAVKVDTGGLCV
jgi:hypothetical protein